MAQINLVTEAITEPILNLARVLKLQQFDVCLYTKEIEKQKNLPVDIQIFFPFKKISMFEISLFLSKMILKEKELFHFFITSRSSFSFLTLFQILNQSHQHRTVISFSGEDQVFSIKGAPLLLKNAQTVLFESYEHLVDAHSLQPKSQNQQRVFLPPTLRVDKKHLLGLKPVPANILSYFKPHSILFLSFHHDLQKAGNILNLAPVIFFQIQTDQPLVKKMEEYQEEQLGRFSFLNFDFDSFLQYRWNDFQLQDTQPVLMIAGASLPAQLLVKIFQTAILQNILIFMDTNQSMYYSSYWSNKTNAWIVPFEDYIKNKEKWIQEFISKNNLSNYNFEHGQLDESYNQISRFYNAMIRS